MFSMVFWSTTVVVLTAVICYVSAYKDFNCKAKYLVIIAYRKVKKSLGSITLSIGKVLCRASFKLLEIDGDVVTLRDVEPGIYQVNIL